MSNLLLNHHTHTQNLNTLTILYQREILGVTDSRFKLSGLTPLQQTVQLVAHLEELSNQLGSRANDYIIADLFDSDCKAYIEPCRTQPYDPDESIENEDCINQVSKQLSTARRNLVLGGWKRLVRAGDRCGGKLT